MHIKTLGELRAFLQRTDVERLPDETEVRSVDPALLVTHPIINTKDWVVALGKVPAGMHATVLTQAHGNRLPNAIGVCYLKQEDTISILGKDGRRHHLYRTRVAEDEVASRSQMHLMVELLQLAERVGAIVPRSDATGPVIKDNAV